jgi:hypothetical protein
MASAAQVRAQKMGKSAMALSRQTGISLKAAWARVKGGRASSSPARAAPRAPGFRAKESARRKSDGLGYWMRRARLTAGALAGALGPALNRGDDATWRATASRVAQRYVGVGLDGAVDSTMLVNNVAGMATMVVDDKIKRVRRHYQMIGQGHALPAAGEGIPYLFAWDAAGVDGGAGEKAAAAYDCLIESQNGYVPSTGEYLGIQSDKLRASLLGSHGGREMSKLLSKFVPGVQGALRDALGFNL